MVKGRATGTKASDGVSGAGNLAGKSATPHSYLRQFTPSSGWQGSARENKRLVGPVKHRQHPLYVFTHAETTLRALLVCFSAGITHFVTGAHSKRAQELFLSSYHGKAVQAVQ